MFRFVVVALCGLLAIPGARAASPLLREAAELPGFGMWTSSGAPGMVLAVVRGDDSLVLGYGNVRPKSDQPQKPNPEPNGRTLIRLNSISKAVTGELLASLAVDGRVRLTDPLSRYLPGVTVPAFGGRAITLLDLATASAGLPRDLGSAPEGTAPWTWPTRQVRAAWLSKFTLPWPPGTVAAYSNVGFDLLADALEGASGEPYTALLRERITGPLGMKDTTLSPDAEQCSRLMVGTGLGAPPAPVCTDTQATAGSGGLYSTADDMVLWLRHLLATDDPKAWPVLAMDQAVYRLRQSMPAAIGFDAARPMAGLGLGWVMAAAHGVSPTILDKSGGGGGFMTYIVFAPGRNAGVFVAVDRVDFAMFLALAGAADHMLATLVTR